MEIEISHDLAQRILQHEEMLISVSDLCGELDCMLALAQGARQYNLVRPRMTEENIIDVKNCRHLLQEMTVPSYVTNDAFLIGGSEPDDEANMHNPEQLTSQASSHPHEDDGDQAPPSTLILTGPNYSGKSIYLKSIALAIYLAHLGSFVPCTSALIGLTDSILTRIRTCETVSRPHSAFMIDLQQIAGILRMATNKSLVVVDEFGKGTDGCDGAGLVAGVLQNLLGEGRGEEGRARPKVLAATHFHEIFEMGFLPPRTGLQFAHMEVRVDAKHHDDDDNQQAHAGQSATQVTYLYNLRPGRSTESFGTQCAAMNGVPAPIVERASQLSTLAAKGEDLVSVCAVGGREEEEDLERAEVLARAFLQWDLADVRDPGGGVAGHDDADPRRVLERLIADVDGEADIGVRTGSENATGSGTEMEPGPEVETGAGSVVEV